MLRALPYPCPETVGSESSHAVNLGTAHAFHTASSESFAEKLSPQIKAQAESMAKRQNRPYQYIESSVVSKEDLAKQIMEQDQITEGLVCVLSCVEPCQSFPSAGTEKLERCLWFRKGESVFSFTFITLIESLG